MLQFAVREAGEFTFAINGRWDNGDTKLTRCSEKLMISLLTQIKDSEHLDDSL